MNIAQTAETYAADVLRSFGFARRATALDLAEAALGADCLFWMRGDARGQSTLTKGENARIGVRVGTALDRAQWLIAWRTAQWCLAADGVDTKLAAKLRANVASAMLLPTAEVGIALRHRRALDLAHELAVPDAAVVMRRSEVERVPSVLVNDHYARVRGDDRGRVPRDLTILRAWAAGEVTPLGFRRTHTEDGTLLAA